jgi:hypothetical protein
MSETKYKFELLSYRYCVTFWYKGKEYAEYFESSAELEKYKIAKTDMDTFFQKRIDKAIAKIDRGEL